MTVYAVKEHDAEVRNIWFTHDFDRMIKDFQGRGVVKFGLVGNVPLNAPSPLTQHKKW